MADSRQSVATLTVARGPGAGRRFDIGAAAVTIGRHAQCGIQLEGTWVSRQHARIAWTGTEYIVEDLGSTNGTFVNDERVGGPRALKSGDLLQLGEQVELAFQVRVSAPLHEEPVLPGMAPSPIDSAGPPRAYAPSSEPIPAQKESFLRRKSTRVWALVLLGVLLSLIIGVGAYYLLSDKGQRVADTSTVQAVLPQPTTVTPAPTPLTLPTVRRFLISTQSNSGSQPVVFGDYVVWAHGTSRKDFYAHNLTTQEETLVASEDKFLYNPLVAGDLLVWLHSMSFRGYRLGAEDAQEFSITDFRDLTSLIAIGEGGQLSYMHVHFALSDRVLVWSDGEGKETSDILAYDLERDERVRITDDGHDQIWPAAAGSLIIWADDRNDDGDVYAYDLDTQEEFQIVTAPLTQTMPSTDGRHVVWIDGRDGNDDVYAYDLESQTEFPVVTGPGDRFLPGVWGNFVIWMEQDSDARCVYGYDLRLDEKFAIACEGGWPADARIWGDVVVWREYREEDQVHAIYGATLEY